jgi:hypothetical protein
MSGFFVNSVSRLNTTPIDVNYTVIHKRTTEASLSMLKAYEDKQFLELIA